MFSIARSLLTYSSIKIWGNFEVSLTHDSKAIRCRQLATYAATVEIDSNRPTVVAQSSLSLQRARRLNKTRRDALLDLPYTSVPYNQAKRCRWYYYDNRVRTAINFRQWRQKARCPQNHSCSTRPCTVLCVFLGVFSKFSYFFYVSWMNACQPVDLDDLDLKYVYF